MSKNVGIWLDRTRAIIVRVEEEECEAVTLTSDLDEARHPRCGTEGHCTIIPEKRMQQHEKEIVKKFYQNIVENIRDAGMILVLGPGMAKTEFANELRSIRQYEARIISVLSADKMSLPQLKSKVREFFESHSSRQTVRSSMSCTSKI